jgi:hypothetical protein
LRVRRKKINIRWQIREMCRQALAANRCNKGGLRCTALHAG